MYLAQLEVRAGSLHGRAAWQDEEDCSASIDPPFQGRPVRMCVGACMWVLCVLWAFVLPCAYAWTRVYTAVLARVKIVVC